MRLAFWTTAAAAAALGACTPSPDSPPPPKNEAPRRNASDGELSFRPGEQPHPAADGALRNRRRPSEIATIVHVPASYDPERAAPLLVMLHGAGGTAGHSLSLTRGHADRLGMIVLAPKSAGASWDIISGGGYGADVAALDAALSDVASRYRIDPRRIALGGFSDGASYALSIGLINGNVFSDVIAFAPCFSAVSRPSGRPRIFMTHGTADRVLPIASCSRRLAPQLERAGYEVDYREFEGGHSVPDALAREAFDRFARR